MLIAKIKQEINDCDAILIGAGAGLSTSAGFVYDKERFKKYFSDFEAKYGFHDMYSGGFYPYKTLEEYWAYWSRYIMINRYQNPPKLVYDKLYQLVKDKNYFVLTTNVDHCFQKAGFNKDRLFCTQGDYGLFQCSKPCHNITYDNEERIKEMVLAQTDMKIPHDLIPLCPICHEPMTMNLRSDNKFVEDESWHRALAKYEEFLKLNKDKRILFLELGVGYNTPSIIKYPFWQMTFVNPKAMYICLNHGEAICPKEIETRAICIDDDIDKILDRVILDE